VKNEQFDNFWYTTSRRNLTSENYKSVHFTCEV